jgi:hypothetical protein
MAKIYHIGKKFCFFLYLPPKRPLVSAASRGSKAVQARLDGTVSSEAMEIFSAATPEPADRGQSAFFKTATSSPASHFPRLASSSARDIESHGNGMTGF